MKKTANRKTAHKLSAGFGELLLATLMALTIPFFFVSF
jgi:hypothetical protein